MLGMLGPAQHTAANAALTPDFVPRCPLWLRVDYMVVVRACTGAGNFAARFAVFSVTHCNLARSRILTNRHSQRGFVTQS